jgi:arginase
MRRIAVLDAPSNLGLRPPTATSVPGCGKAPGALRDLGLIARLDARDAGCVTPPRYDPGDWRPGDGVAHADQIAWYSRRLADRIGALLDAGEFPVVLGGDCSILLGSALAARRRSADLDGHIGLVFVDGHSDFRHPGNASYVGAAAGEDLALVTGRGQGDLAAIENRRPYFRDSDVVVLGIRTHDEHRLDLHAAGIAFRAVPQLRAEGAARSAQWARAQLSDCIGYWVHVDVDVLDPAVMPAVDAPDPGGIAYTELELLLAGLVATPHCLGVEITVFDPDYDPTGAYAAEIVETLVAGLTPAAAVAPLDWAAMTGAGPAQSDGADLVAIGGVVAAAAAAAAVADSAVAKAADTAAAGDPDGAVVVDPPAPRDVGAGDRREPVARAEAPGEPRDGAQRRTVGAGGATRGRSALDRMKFSDMVDADRLALSRRRSGSASLRRRDAQGESQGRAGGEPAGAPAAEPGGSAAERAAGRVAERAAGRVDDPEPVGDTATEVGGDPAERPVADVDRARAERRPATDAARPFAGLAEQVRAAGSGQVPAARTPVEQPPVPVTPPAETA